MIRSRRIFFPLAGLVLLLLSLTAGLGRDSAAAPPNPAGSLDGSFGSGGKITTDFSGGPDAALSVILQTDGKIVVAGYARVGTGYDFALARHNANGSLDTSFGTGGKVTTDFGGRDFGLAMALQSDGKIVVVGYSCTPPPLVVNASCTDSSYKFALARYDANGSLDASFGTLGKVTTDLPGTKEQVLAVVLQPWDGAIVVAGYVFNGSNYDFALARYNSTGTLDASFGSAGIITTDFASRDDQAIGLALQTDGRIVVSGSTSSGGGYRDFALARYNGNGTLDTSFGNGGKVTTDFGGGDDAAPSVAVQTDGQIVAAGFAYTASSDFALARYNGWDGSLDASFGNGGKVTTDFKSRDDRARGLALQSDGKIVAVGGATVLGGFPSYDFALARYNSNGTLDSSFGRFGRVTTDFARGNDFAVHVALQPSDGKIVVAGSASTSTSTDFALARYLP